MATRAIRVSPVTVLLVACMAILCSCRGARRLFGFSGESGTAEGGGGTRSDHALTSAYFFLPPFAGAALHIEPGMDRLA